MRAILTTALIAVACIHLRGGQPGDRLQFDAASVKPVAPWQGVGIPPIPYVEGGPGSRDPTRVVFHKYALLQLLTTAYGVSEYQISGPAWLVKAGYLDADRFEIIATLPAGTTKAQYLLMLQDLLMERFHLKVHGAQVEAPVYELVIGKNGPKLKESSVRADVSEHEADMLQAIKNNDFSKLGPIGKDGFHAMAPGYPAVQPMVRGDRMLCRFVSYSMPAFAAWLADDVKSLVQDRTGLKGVYDFDIEFQRRLQAAPAGADGGALSGDEGAPDLFGAVQSQLGLKMVGRKGQVEMLVVDSADRAPSAN